MSEDRGRESATRVSHHPRNEAEEALNVWLQDELLRRRESTAISSHPAMPVSSDAWKRSRVLEVQIIADHGQFGPVTGAEILESRMHRRWMDDGRHERIVQSQLSDHAYWEGYCYAGPAAIRKHCWLTTKAGTIVDVDPIAETPLAYKGIGFSNEFVAAFRDATSRYYRSVPRIDADEIGTAILGFFYNAAVGNLRENLVRVLGESVAADYEREVCSRFSDIFLYNR